LCDLSRQLLRILCLQCQRVAQQQGVCAGLVTKKSEDLLGAAVVQQEIRVGAE
jgi:hypothetical protein